MLNSPILRGTTSKRSNFASFSSWIDSLKLVAGFFIFFRISFFVVFSESCSKIYEIFEVPQKSDFDFFHQKIDIVFDAFWTSPARSLAFLGCLGATGWPRGVQRVSKLVPGGFTARSDATAQGYPEKSFVCKPSFGKASEDVVTKTYILSRLG